MKTSEYLKNCSKTHEYAHHEGKLFEKYLCRNCRSEMFVWTIAYPDREEGMVCRDCGNYIPMRDGYVMKNKKQAGVRDIKTFP